MIYDISFYDVTVYDMIVSDIRAYYHIRAYDVTVYDIIVSGIINSDITYVYQVAGMLLHYTLSGGCHPYGGNIFDIEMNISRGWLKWKNISSEANHLILQILLNEPRERPDMEVILRSLMLSFRWLSPLNQSSSHMILCTQAPTLLVGEEKVWVSGGSWERTHQQHQFGQRRTDVQQTEHPHIPINY